MKTIQNLIIMSCKLPVSAVLVVWTFISVHNGRGRYIVQMITAYCNQGHFSPRDGNRYIMIRIYYQIHLFMARYVFMDIIVKTHCVVLCVVYHFILFCDADAFIFWFRSILGLYLCNSTFAKNYKYAMNNDI
jgi:hypothetical protein